MLMIAMVVFLFPVAFVMGWWFLALSFGAVLGVCDGLKAAFPPVSNADYERLKWQGKLGPLVDPGPPKQVEKVSLCWAAVSNILLLVVAPAAIVWALIACHKLLTAWGLL